MGSIGFFIDLILPVAVWSETEINNRGIRRPMRRADSLITFMCRWCRKVWEPPPPEGLRASAILTIFLQVLRLPELVLISFSVEMYTIKM
jgi:hypothetical protein